MALGGLASGFGMGPGVSLPRCGRRDGGGVWCVGLGSPLVGGGGWVGSGLRSGRGWFVWCACRLFVCPLLLFAGSPRCGGRPGVGVVPACCGGGCVWGVFVLAD